VFPIGGVNPDTFNIDADLFKKITGCEYFKCLYVFKTFDKARTRAGSPKRPPRRASRKHSRRASRK